MPPHPRARASASTAAVPSTAPRRRRAPFDPLTALVALAAVALAVHLGTTAPTATPSGGPTGSGPVAEGSHR